MGRARHVAAWAAAVFFGLGPALLTDDTAADQPPGPPEADFAAAEGSDRTDTGGQSGHRAAGHQANGREAVGAPTAVAFPAAQQVEGLQQEASTTYEVDADAVVTRVTVEATVTHVRPDDADGYWYYDTYSIAVPSEASELAVTVDGAGTPFDRQPIDAGDGSSDEVTVSFSPVLRYGDSRDLVYHYELGPQEARADVWSQANEAAFMFPVWTLGDPGAGDVTVRVPERYDVEVVGAEFDERRTEDGHTVLASRDIGVPEAFQGLIIAADRSQLLTEETETAVGDVVVRAWPGHDEWVEFVTGQVDEGAPVLADLIGLEWPEDDRSLVVEETLAPIAAGFGGEYTSDDHTVRIPDTQDSHVVLHEVAHVWINFGAFSERWIIEGFAEHLADEARAALGEPQQYQRPTVGELPADPPLALSAWTTPAPAEEADRHIEDYAYPASWYVIGTVADEIGPDAVRDVLVSASDWDMTYVGAGAPEQMTAPMTWRQVLDLFENTGGSEVAAELFATYVVPPDELDLLDERAAARSDYDELAERGGSWAPPFEVRQAMATWDFPRAVEAVPRAHEVLDVRDELDALLADADLDDLQLADLGLAGQYDDADDVDDLLSVAGETRHAVEAYGEARQQRPGGPLAALGLLGEGTDRDLERAREALEVGRPGEALRLSEEAAGQFDGAVVEGALRLVILLLLLAIAVVLFRRGRGRGRQALRGLMERNAYG